MPVQFSETIILESLECGGCGITFAVPQNWKAKKVAEHGSFKCPNGCSRQFTGETKEEKLQRQLEAEQRGAASLRESMIAAQRQRDKAQKALAKLEKRTAAGVCPCCSRTVSQLQRHMQSKHKEFLALNGLAAPKALPEKVQ